MARLPFLSRRGGGRAPDAASPGVQRRALPPAGQLRRERRALGRLRELRLRDLGGLMLEMYRRDQFRQDLLIEHCAALVAVDRRLEELDALLAVSTARRARPAARCECGAPILWGSHYCANCGRPLATS